MQVTLDYSHPKTGRYAGSGGFSTKTKSPSIDEIKKEVQTMIDAKDLPGLYRTQCNVNVSVNVNWYHIVKE